MCRVLIVLAQTPLSALVAALVCLLMIMAGLGKKQLR
jgi:hypothetical protein